MFTDVYRSFPRLSGLQIDSFLQLLFIGIWVSCLQSKSQAQSASSETSTGGPDPTFNSSDAKPVRGKS